MAYIKRGYHSPAANAARARGWATNHERRRIFDRTSCSVDRALKNRAVDLFGDIHTALAFAIEVVSAQTKPQKRRKVKSND